MNLFILANIYLYHEMLSIDNSNIFYEDFNYVSHVFKIQLRIIDLVKKFRASRSN